MILGTDSQERPSAVDRRGAGGALVPPEFWGSEKRTEIEIDESITKSTPGFEKLSTALRKPTQNELQLD